MIRIVNWSCENARRDPFCAPETAGLVVTGVVYGHPRKPDGAKVTTSPIVEVHGREFVTASGNRYELGDPAPEYVAWLETIGKPYDPAHPIRDMRKLRS